MKKIIIAAVGSIFMATIAMAQPPQAGNHGTRSSHGKHFRHHAGKHLNLSEEQKKQAKTIQENYHEQISELRKNDNITMGDYKKQMASLQKERKAKMQALLTPEQKASIAEGKKKREEHAQVRGAARLEKMKIHLGLKDEQVAKIKKQQESFKSKAKAIRDNEGLTQEQKKEQMKSLAKEQRESFKSVLTKEQQEKLESRKKEFKRKGEEAKK